MSPSGAAAAEDAPALPPGFRLLHYASLGSTNDEAKNLASDGAAEGIIVWAGEQTKGRGRLDRRWSSPPGNLYCSCILRPAVPAARAAELGFVAAVAVAEMIRSVLPTTLSVGLKWPNDVLADGGKIAGILLEARSSPDGLVEWIILGIGINVRDAPADTPYRAASLEQLGVNTHPSAVLGALYRILDDRLRVWREEGFAAIRSLWLGLALGLGTRIEIRHGSEMLRGVFETMGPDGSLRLATASGPRSISTGDVHFAPIMGA